MSAETDVLLREISDKLIKLEKVKEKKIGKKGVFHNGS